MRALLRQFVLFCGVLIIYSTATAQSPYEISWKKDLPLVLGGAGGLTTGLILYSNLDVFDAEIDRIPSTSSINAFDRPATRNWSTTSGNISDVFLYGSAALPLALMLDRDMRRDAKYIAPLFAETFIITQGLTSLTKTITKRYRPFVYNENVGVELKEDKHARLSFISGHTATVASLSYFTARVFSDYHPDSKWKPVVWSAAAVLPAATGFLRVRAGKHFTTDVIGGYLVGAAVGLLVPWLHRKDKKKRRKYSIKPFAGADASFRLVYRQLW
ncbi:MAG: phosphatase PAP2 family protein [Bacteroidota bacterium]